MEFNEKTVNQSYIYKGKILNLRRDDILLPDGRPSVREVIEHSGGSSVLCVKDGKVAMVQQLRYPSGEVLYEIPAGKLNKGEKPDLTAIRELEEECGIIAKRVELMYKFYPTPAYDEEIIYIYRAYDFVEGSAKLDEGEFLTFEWMDFDTLKSMIEMGEIKDAKTLIALLSILK